MRSRGHKAHDDMTAISKKSANTISDDTAKTRSSNRRKFTQRAIGILGTLLLPLSAYAAAPKNFKELADTLGSIVDTGTGVLIVSGFVVYFWGISTNILKFEDDPEKRKAYFVWGIIVLFVMVSIWGIIGLLGNTLFGSGLGFMGGGSQTTPGAQANPFSSGEVGFPL